MSLVSFLFPTFFQNGILHPEWQLDAALYAMPIVHPETFSHGSSALSAIFPSTSTVMNTSPFSIRIFVQPVDRLLWTSIPFLLRAFSYFNWNLFFYDILPSCLHFQRFFNEKETLFDGNRRWTAARSHDLGTHTELLGICGVKWVATLSLKWFYLKAIFRTMIVE